MMRYAVLGAMMIVSSGMLLACFSKKPRQVILASTASSFIRTNDTAAVESLDPDTIIVKVAQNPLRDTLIDWPPLEEDQLVVQKRGGVYKQADWAPAIHYDLRKPNFVIIHHTSQHNIAQTIRTFQLDHTKVSAHYVIGKDGQTVQMLNDYDRGWHAGRSKWGAVTDMNSVSIGIELDNNGVEQFPEAQITALLVVLDTLKTRYDIPQINFIGHADIAPTRKNDPHAAFPWKKLAENGFGIWYNADYLLEPPASFNPLDALKIMGYDMRNPGAVIEAFKRKFIVKEISKELTSYDKAVLYDLYRKYY